MQTGVWISLIAYFVLMLGIGFYAYRKSTSDSEEYLLGGRNLPPAVAALSAGASDMSGWLLLGLPGRALRLRPRRGMDRHRPVLRRAGQLDRRRPAPARTDRTLRQFADHPVLPRQPVSRRRRRRCRIVSAVIIVVFFAVYTASGLVAGGKLFQSAFDGGYSHAASGSTLGVVLAYTVVGGFLAVASPTSSRAAS